MVQKKKAAIKKKPDTKTTEVEQEPIISPRDRQKAHNAALRGH